MIALKIEDLKNFTRCLFIGECFDRLQVREAEIVTYNTFHIDGTLQKGYYTEEEASALRPGDYSRWSVLKPICCSLIRGKKLPQSFRIVMAASRGQVKAFLEAQGLSFTPEQVTGLYLNLRYEEGKACCVTGTSLNIFSLDKSLEQAWDKAVEEMFRKNGIACTVG